MLNILKNASFNNFLGKVSKNSRLGGDLYPMRHFLFFFFIKKYFLNVYLFPREGGGGAERERETQDPKQPLGSELSAQSPMRGSNS